MLFRHWMLSMTVFAALGTCCMNAWHPSAKMITLGCVGSELAMSMWHRHVWHGKGTLTKFASKCHAVHHNAPNNLLVDAQDILGLVPGFVTFLAFFVFTGCASFASGVMVHYALTMLVHDELAHGRASGTPLNWLAHYPRHHMHPSESFSVLWLELVYMVKRTKQ
jgi:hypothetical protein